MSDEYSTIPGDVLRMRSFTNRVTADNGDYLELTYKSKPKQIAVFLLLGNERLDGKDPLDVKKRLNELGWFEKEAKKDDGDNTRESSV
jgi:hypothetical protein